MIDHNEVRGIFNPKYMKLVEDVAEVCHEQWLGWAKVVLDEVYIQRRRRWEKDCFKPYSELSEEMKERDRKYAREIIDLIQPDSADKRDEIREIAEKIRCGCIHHNPSAYDYDEMESDADKIIDLCTPDKPSLRDEIITILDDVTFVIGANPVAVAYRILELLEREDNE